MAAAATKNGKNCIGEMVVVLERPSWILGDSARSTAAATKGGGSRDVGNRKRLLWSKPGLVTGRRNGADGGNEEAAAMVGQWRQRR